MLLKDKKALFRDTFASGGYQAVQAMCACECYVQYVSPGDKNHYFVLRMHLKETNHSFILHIFFCKIQTHSFTLHVFLTD